MSLTKNIGVIATLGLVAGLAFLGAQSQKQLAENSTRPLVAYQNKTQDMLSVSPEAQALKNMLEEKLPGIEINDIEKSPVEGFYQVFYSGQLLYVSDNGQYLFMGNLLELAEGSPVNHSQDALDNFQNRLSPMRAQAIASLKEADMVIYRAKDEKHVITVFTDVDCGYCRKLHREIEDFNDRGITVRYLAYPRAGIGSDAYQKLVSVWCADDRLAAMDDAKLRRKFESKSCNNPINQHYDLTRQFNLAGTPAIILDDGELIGGYVPAQKLASHLAQKETTTNNRLTSAQADAAH
ncbi:thioredoxin fold domain-containing protein [Aliikangiella maris]|uniref:Thiol:disulfide interchange protein n=2 Tax=Aliikangiella maris TaxID=3162458 RepID=A0ABV2BNJ0_9GAMM